MMRVDNVFHDRTQRTWTMKVILQMDPSWDLLQLVYK